MPPAVRIESKAWDDPAFIVLAQLMGWPDADLAIVKCARIWAHCTEQNDPSIRVAEADALARAAGFAAHMVSARLADASEHDPDVIVVRGATGKNRNRISWLATKRKNARKGGAAMKAKGKPIGFGSGGPKGSPNAPAPAPAPAGATTEEPASAGAAAPKPRKPARHEPSDGQHKAVVDGWDALYRARTGTGYTWASAAEHGRVESLLKLTSRDSAEVLRRAAILCNKPPPWIAKGGGAPTLSTLLANFAALVETAPAQPERTYNGRG